MLEPTKGRVLARAKDLQAKGIENVDGQLRRASRHAFYNVSRYDFQKLLDDPCESHIGKYNAIISKNAEVIAKLHEYRTALISAAVTGKINVRETIGG